ncbi:MAG: ABC transporter permease, partial [Clostridiaceae bacterium]|nr:ABC transporter permease [Clostridiaceae bacterium]
MKNAFAKNLLREIKNSKSRFLSILVIVAIGVAFFAGIRATSPDMIITGNKYLHDYSIADLRVLSNTGFTDKDIDKIKSISGVEAVIPGYNFDAYAVIGEEEKPVKINSYKIGGQMVNKPVLIEGKLPTSEDECVTET